MTFEEFLIQRNVVSEDERIALIWHLALCRARKTVELLMDDTEYKRLREELLSVLRDKM